VPFQNKLKLTHYVKIVALDAISGSGCTLSVAFEKLNKVDTR